MGWYEALKDVLTVADRLKDAELKNKLATVQMEGARLAEENARLRQELMDLREQVKMRQEMKFKANVYWRQEEGPFCPKCLDGKDKASRMTELPGDHFWRCPVCNYASQKMGGTHGSSTAETAFDPLTS